MSVSIYTPTTDYPNLTPAELRKLERTLNRTVRDQDYIVRALTNGDTTAETRAGDVPLNHWRTPEALQREIDYLHLAMDRLHTVRRYCNTTT